MRKLALSGIIALVVASMGFILYAAVDGQSLTQQPTVQAEPQVVLSKYETGPPDPQELLELVNNERAKAGVKPLELYIPANDSAQFKAEDMAKRNYYEHADPKTGRNNGLDYLDTIDNGTCQYMSENLNDLTEFDDTSWQVIYNGGWTASKPHYKAMVDDRYEYVGFGHAEHYTVAHFCDIK